MSIITAILFLASSGMTTYALWLAEDWTFNVMTIGQLRGRIVEDYEMGQTVYPGATVTKVVQIRNEGHVDMIVRVRIEKAWGIRQENGNLVRNNALPTDNIEITFNDADWLWIDGEGDEDGFFYYMAVLEPGDLSRPLMEYFYICSVTTDNRFAGMDADIVVDMEAVQAGGGGVSYWGLTLEDLNIEYDPEQPERIDTYVIFINPDQGFFFPEANEGNLFAMFQEMVPGEQRRQVITIDSYYNDIVEIFLRADVADQVYVEEAQLELINRMLREYAIITVTHAGNVIYNGPVWGNLEYPEGAVAFTDNGTMRENISLGMFDAGEEKTMYVDITLSTAMRNEFMELMGVVQWVLAAQGGEEPETTTTTEPTTTTEETTTTTGTGEPTTTTAEPATTTAPPATTTVPPTTTAPPTTTQPPSSQPITTTQPTQAKPGTTTTRPATVPQTGLLENGDLLFFSTVLFGSLSLMFFVMWRKIKKRHDQAHEEFIAQNF